MTNRPDLIAQLSKLTPTKRQWVYDGIKLIRCHKKNLFISHDAKQDDIHLITLAPTMRIEILAMAKEIEELKSRIKTSEILSANRIKTQPNIKMVTACGMFVVNTQLSSATICKNCGKEKYLHVTPQP